MTFGSLVVALCLILLGWTEQIVAVFVKDPDRVQGATIALAILSIYAVDFAINIGMSTPVYSFGRLLTVTVQACCRSLIVDTLPIPLQQSGSAWAGRMSAIGQLVGYGVGSIDTVSILGTFLGDTQFKQMTVIAAMFIVGSVLVTSYAVKERILITAR